MRQLMYTSLSAKPGDGADLAAILQQSRHNNAIDGISGILWSDGEGFLQILEGPEESVEAAFDRIKIDKRHHSLSVVLDRIIYEREFGNWTMAHRRFNEPSDIYEAQMTRLLSNTSSKVRAKFITILKKEQITVGLSLVDQIDGARGL